MKLVKSFSILLATCTLLVQCAKENPFAMPYYPVPNPSQGNSQLAPQVKDAVIPGKLIEVNRFSVKGIESLGAKVDVFVAGMGQPNAIKCEFKSHPGFGTEMPSVRWANLPLALTSNGSPLGTVGPAFGERLHFYQKDSANFSFRVDFTHAAKIFRALYRMRTSLVEGNTPSCTAHMDICRTQDLRPTGATEGGKPVFACAEEGRWSEIRGLQAEVDFAFRLTGFKLFLVGPRGATAEENIGSDGLLPATD